MTSRMSSDSQSLCASRKLWLLSFQRVLKHKILWIWMMFLPLFATEVCSKYFSPSSELTKDHSYLNKKLHYFEVLCCHSDCFICFSRLAPFWRIKIALNFGPLCQLDFPWNEKRRLKIWESECSSNIVQRLMRPLLRSWCTQLEELFPLYCTPSILTFKKKW